MKPPRFWASGLDPRSREAAPLTRVLLTPISALYAFVVGRKLKSAAPIDAGLPVICIGNLTVGGVGKTPIVQAVRAHLSDVGLRSASLSRGYGGKLKGPLKVSPGEHSAADIGDEPLMLALSGESWIGADRAAAAKAMKAVGVQAIVMDDGHQNHSLQKTLSLIVMDASTAFGNGYVIPKGPLREPVSSGLARAEGVILIGDGATPPEVAQSALPVWRAKLVPQNAPPAGPLVAFAGIGRPEKFFDGLKAAGASLAEEVPFPDHHAFSSSDLDYLQTLSAERGAGLITTEKDHVRLPPEMRSRVTVFPITAQFEMPTALDDILSPVLKDASA